MDFLGTLFLIFFWGMVIITALSFGFVLIMWLAIIVIGLAISMYFRQWWARWLFIHRANKQPRPPKIIEGEYEDITKE